MNRVNAINLVGDQDDRNLLGIVPRGVDEDLSPLLKVVIGLGVGNVKDKDASVAAPVEGGA
jgi:hypothetical protein